MTAAAKTPATSARSKGEATPAKGQASYAFADKKEGHKETASAPALAPAPREVIKPGPSAAEANKPPAAVIAASASQPTRNEPAPAAPAAETPPAVCKPPKPAPPAGGNDPASPTEAGKLHRAAGKERDQRIGQEGLSLAPVSLVLVPLPEPAAVTFPSPVMPPPLIAGPVRPARFPLAALHPTALPERSEESLPNIPVPVTNLLLPPVAARVDSPSLSK